MRVPRRLLPTDGVSSAEVAVGLKMLLLDGICTQTMLVLSGGAFLVAYALLMGASNKMIGLLFAIPWAAQMLQLPSTLIVERVGLRKALVVASAGISRTALIAMAAVPWVVSGPGRLAVLVMSLALFWGVGAIGGCAFSPWMRDLVPDRVRGRYFGRRLAAAVAVGAAVSILGGVGVDAYRARWVPEVGAYTILLLVAAAVGFLGVGFLSRTPEPRMKARAAGGIGTALAEPLRDANFRRLLLFVAIWYFSMNLATPFFPVYMLTKLRLSMTWITTLFLVSQSATVVFLNIWGKLADRFSNRSVLAVAAPMFMASTLLWPLTGAQTAPPVRLALLAAIHVLSGVAMAGTMLCGWNIALKLAPRASSTSYLAIYALVFGGAASVAPVLGGAAVDWLAARDVALTLGGLGPLSTMRLDGPDFLFAASAVAGAVSLRFLARVEERGDVEGKEVVAGLYAELRAVPWWRGARAR
jgi:MFS family permease